MSTSLHSWHEHSASSMEGVEEGFLDETDQPIITFTTLTECHWKELVSEPCEKSSPTARAAENNWEHSLSAFTLNAEETSKFYHVQNDFRASDQISVGDDEESKIGESIPAGILGDNVTLPVVTNFAESRAIENGELKKSGCLMKSDFEDCSFPMTLKQDFVSQPLSWSVKESISKDGRKLYASSDTTVRPGSAPAVGYNGINYQNRLMTGTDKLPTSSLENTSKSIERPRSVPLQVSPGVDWKPPIQMYKSSHPISRANILQKTEQIMPQSSLSAKEATEVHKQNNVDDNNILVVSEDHLDVNTSRHSYDALINKPSFNKNNQLSEQPNSSSRGFSASLLQDTRFMQSPSSSARFMAEKGVTADDFNQPNAVPIIDDFERPLELTNISGANEGMLLDTAAISNATSTRDTFAGFTTVTRKNTNKSRAEKELIPFEGVSHVSGDGKHEIKSDENILENFVPLYEVKEHDTGETQRELKDSNPHADIEHVFNAGVPNDDKDAALLVDIESEPAPSRFQNTSPSSGQPWQMESTFTTPNLATSRKTAENLPVRPLTIGDSLTIAAPLTYRPVSPFQPSIDPAASPPIIPSTTSLTTMYHSPYQYSEGLLDAHEEIEDMPPRERLQPLGQDGFEVKQGPLWGITMPLFQPDSCNSSLSSNNTSTSSMRFTKLRKSVNQQTKLETEPLESRSSTSSEAGLSCKASIKSLEPKEPMGVKLMSGASNFKTPLAQFRQQNVVTGDSPVSKILGPTFKATQQMLEELQRKPLGAYEGDLAHYPTDNENGSKKIFPVDSNERLNTNSLIPNTSYDGIVGEAGEDSHTEGSNHSRLRDGNKSKEKVNKTPRNSYCEPSTIQVGTDVVPRVNLREVNVSYSSIGGDLQQVVSNTTTEFTSSHAIEKRFPISQHTPHLMHVTPASLGELKSARSSSPERDTFQSDVDKKPSGVTTGLKTSDVPRMAKTTHRVGDNNSIRQVDDNRPISTEKNLSASTRSSFSEGLLTRSSLSSTPTTMANSVSQTCDPPNETVHSQKNETTKTRQISGVTDSTLSNSVALPADLVQTPVEENKEGSGHLQSETLPLTNISENAKDASNLSEFDRVASASISWSNAVANKFREEMKSVDLDVQEGFLELKDRQSLVNQPNAATPVVDSGLSESSTNDEIYRPKRLLRLSVGNRPVGIYDIRHSSSPGSTNRKRIALGKKPRESLKSVQTGNIYVSDATIETNGTDKDSLGRSISSHDRINEDVYVSDRTTSDTIRDSQRKSRRIPGKVHANYATEETTSGPDLVDNGVESSGSERQSTPNLGDIATTQRTPLTASDLSSNESNKKMSDIGIEFDKPFTANVAINKLPQRSASAFTGYKPYRRDPSAFSTFEIDKPVRTNPTGSSRDGTLTKGNANLGPEINHGGQNVCNVSQLPSAANVEHTWSISKPVMSQLNTGPTPLLIHDAYVGATSTTVQPPVRQTNSQQYKQHRNSKERQTRHSKDESSGSNENRKERGKSASGERKKSMADIILENMIQEEREQKKRQRKLEVRQEQTSQDLNHLWDRFQEVFGKKSQSSRRNKKDRVIPSTYTHMGRSCDPVVPSGSPPDETTPTDTSPTPSSDLPSKESSRVGRRSVDIITDSDEEFERFLHRVREMQSSESSHWDNSSTSLRSSEQPALNAPTDRTHHKPPQLNVDSSTSITSIASQDKRRVRRSTPQMQSYERPTRKQTPQNEIGQVVTASSVSRKYENPVSLPMWLNMKNMEMIKKGKTSNSCTCGAKSRKGLPRTATHGFRDVGVNCPTPPLHGAQTSVAADIALLKAGPSNENIPRSAPASTVKLTLQDAFMYSNQKFIDRSKERVKKLKEKCQQRKQDKTSNKGQVVVVVPSEKSNPKRKDDKNLDERIFNVMKPSKKFEQLTQKKPRPMTNKEIRDVNKRMYENLPEVRKKKAEDKRAEFYKTNRLRAQLYGKQVRNTNRIFSAA